MKRLPFFKNIFQLPFTTHADIPSNADTLRKINLIQLFNLVALIFVFPLGVKALFTHNYNIALPLLFVSFMIFSNYYYLKKSYNAKFASHSMSMLFFLLMLYLIYSGGISNTGPLWIFSLPLIVFFLVGLRKGFVYIILFLVLSSMLFFFPFESILKTNYPYEYKVRIILSFLVITFLAAMYEYSNNKAFNHMKRLKEDLEFSSTRDHLTSLYNRRGYDKHIKSMQNAQGIVLMCDIDHFKKINDTYGHEAGDFVLTIVSQEIKSILREEDIAVRWGGEEFFIFLPHASLEDGHLVAEKIRKSVEALLLKYEGQHIAVTFSIGLEEITQNISLEDAINNADNAMYQAKQLGRNTIVKFSS